MKRPASPEKLLTTFKIANEGASRVLRGEATYANPFPEQITDLIEYAEQDGIDLGPLMEEALYLLLALPKAEIDNCRNLAEKYADAGNDADAAFWRDQARLSLSRWSPRPAKDAMRK